MGVVSTTTDGSIDATAIWDARVKPANPVKAGPTQLFFPSSFCKFSWVLALMEFWPKVTNATVDGMQEIAKTAALEIFIIYLFIYLTSLRRNKDVRFVVAMYYYVDQVKKRESLLARMLNKLKYRRTFLHFFLVVSDKRYLRRLIFNPNPTSSLITQGAWSSDTKRSKINKIKFKLMSGVIIRGLMSRVQVLIIRGVIDHKWGIHLGVSMVRTVINGPLYSTVQYIQYKQNRTENRQWQQLLI